jgi:hypothetical protein
VQLIVCTVFTVLPLRVCRPDKAVKDKAPLGLKFDVLLNNEQVQVPALRTGLMFDNLDTSTLPHEVDDSASEQHDRVITADSTRYVAAASGATDDDDAGSAHSYQDEDVHDGDGQESQVIPTQVDTICSSLHALQARYSTSVVLYTPWSTVLD